MADQTVWPAATNGLLASGRLSDDTGDYLRELIVSGQIRPGTRVRPESIAEALGISATPAREALQALRVEGFLRLEPRRGFTVAPLSGDDIRDVFVGQSLLGGELAARACGKATSSDVAALRGIQDDLRQAASTQDHAAVEERNHAFHREVNVLADSPKLAAFVRLLSRYAPRRFYATIDGWQERTLEDHEALLAAFENGDSEAARTAMSHHLTQAGLLLAQHFDARMSE